MAGVERRVKKTKTKTLSAPLRQFVMNDITDVITKYIISLELCVVFLWLGTHVESLPCVFQVGAWFQKLFPSVCYPVQRLSGSLGRLKKMICKMHSEGADLTSTLETEVDFDFISPSVSLMGLRRGHLTGETPRPFGPFPPVTNEVVIDLEKFRSKENLKEKFTIQWITTLMGPSHSETDIKYSVKKTMECFKKLSSNKGKDEQGLLSLELASYFKIIQPPVKSSVAQGVGSASQAKVDMKTTKGNVQLQEKVKSLEETIVTLNEAMKELSQEKLILLKAEKENEKLQQAKLELQGEVKRQQKLLKDSKPDSDRLRYLTNANIQLRAKVRSAEKKKVTIKNLKQENQELKQIIFRNSETHKREMRRIREKERKRQDQEKEQEAVQNEPIAEHMKPNLRGPRYNQFADNVRQLVMALQSDCNVAAGQCSSVIKVVAKKLFGVEYTDKDLPVPQSSINISNEGHVLAKVQVAERVLESDNFTLHTDGTSRGGQKIVGHQVTLDTGESLSLGFTTVASEDAATLLEITTGLLQEISDLYCQGEEMEAEGREIFHKLLARLTSVMTDRAATMKSFDAKLLDFLNSELGIETSLHFLHCNAHFLLGLSRSCDMALKSVEEKEGRKLGRDAVPKFQFFKSTETATSRVLRLTSDIIGPRGDDKNGCRAEWLAFCEENGFNSHMTSYRSNRFNCYFLSAAAIIHHLPDLQRFLKEHLGHSNNKIDSVAADIQDETLLSFVCVLALLYIQVTGPFWNLLDSKVKYVDFHVYVQKLEDCCLRWQEDASDLVRPDFLGVFDGEFQLESELKQSVMAFAALHGKVKTTLESMMQEILKVMRSQLADFLSGGKYSQEQPPEIQRSLQHCPLTNLLGENAFGELDFDMNKRRHASFHQRSSTQMQSCNKTSAWLGNKGEAESTRLMAAARKQSHVLREHHRRQEQLVRLKIREKLLENRRQKQLKAAKAAEMRAALIRRVLGHGGPCQRREDVARLIQRQRKVGASQTRLKIILKDEVRFQKIIVNKKGQLKLVGTLDDLRRSLEDHLPVHRGPLPVDVHAAAAAHTDEPPPAAHANETAGVEADLDNSAAFQFKNQGQWVAVYYDESYFIGQVVDVKVGGQEATVQYLEQTKGRKDFFRWPKREDVAETSAQYVFRWDFECLPVSSDHRIWQVTEVEDIAAAYAVISRQ